MWLYLRCSVKEINSPKFHSNNLQIFHFLWWKTRLQTKLWRERGELTTGRHSVPPCTSSWADPSSKLGGSGCNGCFPRCNETFPHPSESSRSRNPRWMSGRLWAGGHKGTIEIPSLSPPEQCSLVLMVQVWHVSWPAVWEEYWLFDQVKYWIF